MLEVEGRKKEEKTEDKRFEGDGWVHCHDCSNGVIGIHRSKHKFVHFKRVIYYLNYTLIQL